MRPGVVTAQGQEALAEARAAADLVRDHREQARFYAVQRCLAVRRASELGASYRLIAAALGVSDADIEEGLSAASAVGDDRVQEKTSGRVDPESRTHGSAAQRQKWFCTGLSTGDPKRCDTFAADRV